MSDEIKYGVENRWLPKLSEQRYDRDAWSSERLSCEPHLYKLRQYLHEKLSDQDRRDLGIITVPEGFNWDNPLGLEEERKRLLWGPE